MPNYKTTPWSDLKTTPFPALEGDLTVDVAIVGGGITGVTAARLLARAGVSVALLESRRLGSGETNKTTAHLTELLDTRLHRLMARFGKDGARLAVRGQRAAMERIISFVDELGIACQLDRLPAYLWAESPEQAGELEAELEILELFDLPARIVDDTPLPFAVRRALRVEDQAQLHPRAYLEGLVGGLEGEKCRIFETTHVREIEEGEPCRVVTDRGVVTAAQVIVASGVPISNRYFVHPKLAAYRTYVLAVALEREAPRGLFFDMNDPYHYLRGQTVDGRPYLIVGGEDHRVGENEDTTQPFESLEAYVRLRFKQDVAPTDYRWSGQIIEPADGLPYVGRNAMSSHVFIATGYGGNGITGGTLAAMLLADEVRKVDNPWRELLAATRIKPLASARAVLSENLAFPKHLLADRLVALGRRGELAKLAPGAGAVLSIDGEKLAVYCNAEGQLSALSAVCPHLGVLVHWNQSSSSWDCPGHGSRFDAHGRLLNGPATCGLESKPLLEAREAAAPRREATTTISTRPAREA